jgi:hypothetical protein
MCVKIHQKQQHAMACIKRCCRCNGIIHSCTTIEAINMNPPTVITSQYEDQCGCRTCCSYPNNVWSILPAQILSIIAFSMSTESLSGCQLVRVQFTTKYNIDDFTIKLLYNGTIPSEIDYQNSTSRSLGFFTWEDIDGSCGGINDDYHGTDDTNSIIERYWVYVGSDFKRLLFVAGFVATLGFVVVLWMICILSCVAHKRRYRGILVVVLTIILPVLQSLTFRVLATEICQKTNCELDKSGYMAIVAIVLYFMAGVFLCVGTRDFPGNPYKKQKQGAILTTLRSYFSKQSESFSDHETNENNNMNQLYDRSPTVDVEMINYTNGFADAVEIPVESEFIDRTLIEQDEIRLTTTHATIILADSMDSTNAHGMNDSNSIEITSPDNIKSNV